MRSKLHALLILFVFFVTPYAFSQEMNISGKVIDDLNTPLPGANITIEGSTVGTTTDFDGNFSIKATVGDKLEITYLGFKTITIKVVAGKTTYNVTMEPEGQTMDEVVVVAYGQATKESITGSIASIDSKAIEKRPLTNALGALEGAAAGVQVNNTSGQPGSGQSIRIRGFTTINGSNAPLYVVDGVPFDGNFSDINPADINSISILKDASASALYGNRASNGVVLIETKGASGKNGLNLTIKQGFYNRGIDEYDKVGPDAFMESMWQGYRNALLTDNPDMSRADANQKASNSLVDDYLSLNIYDAPDDQLFTDEGKLRDGVNVLPSYRGDLNWFDPVERLGYRQEYGLTSRTGNEKGGVYFSINYLDEEGYVEKSDFNRLNATISANNKPKDWLELGITMRGSTQTENELGSLGSTTIANPIYFARNIAPIYPVHRHDPASGEFVLGEDENPIYDNGEGTRNQLVGRHAIEEHFLNKNRLYRNTLQTTVYADINFLKDFTFSVKGDLNLRDQSFQGYDNSKIGDGQGNNGRASRTKYRYKDYTGQELLRWERKFDDHNLEVLVGHENYYTSYQYLRGAMDSEGFEGNTNLVNFNNITALTDYHNTYRTEGYFGRAKYNFNKKYYGEVSFRRDGSSKFAKATRWGNFWSVGGSWIVSNEDFLDADFIDNLKVRASYGEVGNDSGAGTYAYQALYTISQNANLPAVWKVQNEAADLQWETSSSFGIGIESRLFNRLNFTAEYFDKTSNNLLFDINLPLSAGSTSTGSASAELTKNLGSISNKGVELTFDVEMARTRDWRWNVGANATFLNNKIESLPEENRENGIISGNKKRIEGRGIYDFFMYKYQGVDQLTGDALYTIDDETYDVNGSNPDADEVPEEYLREINGTYYTTNTTYGLKDWSGSAIPDVFGSFNTGVTWKNLSLNALFTYQIGGNVYDSSYRSLMSISGTPGALHQDILESWNGVPQGITETSADRIDPDGTPKIDFSNSSYNNASSDRFLHDASYLVIKNITLSYGLPDRISHNIGVQSVNFNASIDNLATFTKLKGMNTQYSYAGSSTNNFVTPRVFTVGINVGI